MARFISGDKNTKGITEFLNTKKPLKLAVAFWGSEAVNLLPQSKHKVQIICNLESGATNPLIIERLSRIENVTILSNSKLHAKVYLSKDMAIVGSSNVSSNGLSFEDSEVEGWIEASVVIDDASELKPVKRWFDKTWRSSVEVTEDMLEEAKLIWSKRRNNREILKSDDEVESVFTKLERDRNLFKDRNIYVLINRTRASKEEEEKFAVIAGQLGANKQINFYTDWPHIPESTLFIELYWSKKGEFKFDGLFKTPPIRIIKEFTYENGKLGVFSICFELDTEDPFQVRKLDQALLKDKVKDLWGSSRSIGISTKNNGIHQKSDVSRLISLFDAKDILFPKK